MKANMVDPVTKTVRLPLMEQQMLQELKKLKEKKYDNEIKFTESDIIRAAIQFYHKYYIIYRMNEGDTKNG